MKRERTVATILVFGFIGVLAYVSTLARSPISDVSIAVAVGLGIAVITANVLVARRSSARKPSDARTGGTTKAVHPALAVFLTLLIAAVVYGVLSFIGGNGASELRRRRMAVAKADSTKMLLINLVAAAEQYSIIHGSFPQGGPREVISALVTPTQLADGSVRRALVEPPDWAVTEEGFLVDTWGTAVRIDGADGSSVTFVSAGPDGTFDTRDDIVQGPLGAANGPGPIGE